MIDEPRDAIASALRVLRGDGSFATRRTAAVDGLAIDVKGVGELRCPVPASQGKALRLIARPAKYGQGEETLLDRRVRDTWEVPRSRVRIDQRRWNRTLRPMLDEIRADLGLPDTTSLRAELHSMLVYEPGQFFAPHQDSEKHDAMIATLVVMLPSRSTGGDLVIEHCGESVRFAGSATSLVFVAFYSDARHEVLPVESGYRVALTYNLLLTGDTAPTQPGAALIGEVARFVDRHFTHTPAPRWHGDRQALELPDRLVVLLDHQYTERGLRWSHLKGDDVVRAEVLRGAAEAADCALALAQAEVHETRECFDDEPPRWRHRGWNRYNDEDDQASGFEVGDLLDVEITITPAVGERVRLDASVDAAEIAEVTPTLELTPHDSEYTGYMGNYGNTMDRWYRRAAIVIWPRARAFAVFAKGDPAGALDAILSSNVSDDTSRGERTGRVETLLRFWPGAVRAGDQQLLLPRTLRLASEMTDAGLARRLVEPFSLEALTDHDAPALVAVVDRHGTDWFQHTLATWLDRRNASTDVPTRAAWAAVLPDLCTGLRSDPGRATAAGEDLARAITARVGEWLITTIDATARVVTPSRRDAELATLTAPTLGVLRATSIVDDDELRERIIANLCEPSRRLDTMLVAIIEATAPLAAIERTSIGIDTIAEHCRDSLTASLARPTRASDDWSITDLADRTCCADCTTLAIFLADPSSRQLTWPLAKPRRQHIHHRLDEAELPVTHATTRQGSPHKLVLTKTPELHRRDTEHRRGTQRALELVDGYLRQMT